tara:strand:- start:5777 stop:5998 length:222 start_codon:yes stop_codon:yes gene_type:complete
METEFQLQDDPRNRRDFPSHDAQDVEIAAKGVFVDLPENAAKRVPNATSQPVIREKPPLLGKSGDYARISFTT